MTRQSQVVYRWPMVYVPRLVAVLIAMATVALVLAPVYAQQGPPVYIETFTLNTSQPTPYRPPGFDISVVAHDDDSIEPMWAEHGPDCSPPQEQWPGGQPDPRFNHHIDQIPEAVFSCRDHIMTAMNAGYGATYITVPALMDWSNGPARFEWDMSTERTSSRDWMDVVIQPFEPGFDGPMALNFQDFHTPHDVLQFELQGGGNVWAPHIVLPGPVDGCSGQSYWRGNLYYCRFGFDGYNSWDRMLAAHGLSASAARRDHFMIEVSRTHVKMGFRVNPNEPYQYWVDRDIPGGALKWSSGVTQLNQRSYNPLKGCGAVGTGEPGHPPDGWVDSGGHTCRAGTWHIDNMQISPFTPISIIPGAHRIDMPGGTVTFPVAAPENSFVKASGGWSDTEYSLDGGRTWSTAAVVGPKAPPQVGDSYWFPVPAGTRLMAFRGSDPRWSLHDVYLYSRTLTQLPPTPTPGPTNPQTMTPTVVPSIPTSTATPEVTPEPTVTATPEPTMTPEPGATETPTPEPTATATPEPPAVTPTPALPIPTLPVPTIIPTLVVPSTCAIDIHLPDRDIHYPLDPAFCAGVGR